MKKRTKLVIGIVVVLIAVGVVIASNNQSSAAQADVQLGRVTRATLSSVVESSGSVLAESAVTLAFETAGTVARVNVQVGDRVKQGDVLATLDTRGLERQVAMQEQAYLSQQAGYSLTVQPDPAEVAAAQAALNNASAAYQLAQQKYAVNGADQVMLSCLNVDNAKKAYDDAVTAYNNYRSDWHVQVYGTYEVSPQKAQLDRATAAYDQALASCNLAKNSAGDDSSVKAAFAQLQSAKVALDQLVNPSELTLATAQAQLDQARQSLDQARRQLDQAQLIAPFEGVVTQVAAVVGGPGSGASILLADLSRYHVDVLVDETEIAQVQLGQTAQTTFDALPDVTVAGVVSRIDPVATISNGVVNYTVRVDLDPTAAALRIDMTANARVILDTHADVLAVPGGALRSDGNTYYVNGVDANGAAQRVDVTTGYTDGDLTEVTGDLQPGQPIYIGEPAESQSQQSGFNLFGLRLGGR
ncbi:MAG TPA: efflux RND transporter periplasmic adaptor subunit [Anaerolineae bacterium]|nr:efflux RND transporter periplasmic adaptor subunit [Anaerolineae bacterium]